MIAPSKRYAPFCDFQVNERVAPFISPCASPKDATPSVALPADSSPKRKYSPELDFTAQYTWRFTKC